MAGLSLLRRGVQALQKGRVQKKLKEAERLDPKGVNLRHVSQDYPSTGTKIGQQRKIQEAQKKAKGAERGTKTEQVAKRVLPEVSKVRSRLKGMSANNIAREYTGKEITSMMRKIKDLQVLAKLRKARKIRETAGRKFETFEKGEKHTPGQKLRFKYEKAGGTIKRKSGGLLGMGAALRGGGAVRKR